MSQHDHMHQDRLQKNRVDQSKASHQKVADARYDLVIVGAGLVGSALVCALQRLPLRILLLDRMDIACVQDDKMSTKHQHVDAQHSRPLSLAHSSFMLMQQLKLWQSAHDDLPALNVVASPIKKVHVSKQHAFSHVEFSAEEMKLDALGYVVPARLLQLQLARRALQLVHFQQIKGLLAIEQQAESSSVRLIYENKEGQQLACQASLLIGADGTHSQVAQCAGLVGKSRPSSSAAITASLHLDVGGKAYERFLKKSVLALLPQGAERAGMVWVMPKAQAQKQHESWTPVEWQDAIAQAMSGHVDTSSLRVDHISGCYPLQTQQVDPPFSGRVLLLGNAAHTLYPLAAQGFNLSLRDVALFAELLAQHLCAADQQAELWQRKAKDSACKTKDDPLQLADADIAQLFSRYQLMRRGDWRATAHITRALVNAYRLPPLPGVAMARSLFMLSLGVCDSGRHSLAKRFLGVKGQVPRLMRGLEIF